MSFTLCRRCYRQSRGRRAQRRDYFGTACKAICWTLLQQTRCGRRYNRRHIGSRDRDGRRRVQKAFGDECRGACRRERNFARQHLEKHATEREQITSSIEGIASGLLGAQVRRCTNCHTNLRNGRMISGRSKNRLANAKVGNNRVPLVQKNILRLDVPMHDVVPMGVIERVGDFGGNSHGLVDREPSYGVETFTQRLPLHHRRHEIQNAIRLAGVVQRKDVRVIESRRELDFAKETLAPQRFGELGAQHLDCNLATMLAIMGEIDGGHSALTELTIELVAVGERAGERFEVGHGRKLPSRIENAKQPA